MTEFTAQKVWCGAELVDGNDVQRLVVCDNGHRVHRDEQGRLHREDGPAIEQALGLPWHQWWIHGRKHRDPLQGPALEFEIGKLYCWNGSILLNEDGALMSQAEAILYVHGQPALDAWMAQTA